MCTTYIYAFFQVEVFAGFLEEWFQVFSFPVDVWLIQETRLQVYLMSETQNSITCDGGTPL